MHNKGQNNRDLNQAQLKPSPGMLVIYKVHKRRILKIRCSPLAYLLCSTHAAQVQGRQKLCLFRLQHYVHRLVIVFWNTNNTLNQVSSVIFTWTLLLLSFGRAPLKLAYKWKQPVSPLHVRFPSPQRPFCWQVTVEFPAEDVPYKVKPSAQVNSKLEPRPVSVGGVNVAPPVGSMLPQSTAEITHTHTRTHAHTHARTHAHTQSLVIKLEWRFYSHLS